MTNEEAILKLQDKDWRMDHLYKVQTKDSKLVQFKRNLAQRDFARERTNRDMILKARQLGFTTECCLNLLDDTLMTPNTASAIVAHKRENVTIIFEIVRRAFKNFPDELKPEVSFDNRNELYFPEIDSKIFVTLDARGKTIHNLHVSELAFLEDAHSQMASILETVPKNGKITFESTANGTSGYYYDEWMNENSEFKKHFYNWLWDSTYVLDTPLSLDELRAEYKEHTIRYGLIPDLYERFDLTKEQFFFYISKIRRQKNLVVQEYPSTPLEAFISSGRNVFHISDIQKHRARPPIDRKWNDVLLWEYPSMTFRYVIGCDVAEGLGGDFSVIDVFNVDTGDQAAQFRSNAIPPDRLADYLYEIGKYFNNAFIVIEVNNHGRVVVDAIKKRYYNLYRRQVFDKVTNQHTQAIGWRTSSVTKPLLVDNLEQAVREVSLNIFSSNTIKELKTFIQSDEPGKQGFGAEGSNHDDCVISAGLALQGIKNMPRAKTPESVAQKKLREYLQKYKMPDYLNESINSQVQSRHRPRQLMRK